MKIKDFIMFLPRGIVAGIVKSVRTNPTEQMKQYISENGLYHITKDEQILDKIIETGTIKKTKSIVNSYGLPVTYLFAGIPHLEDYMKNMMVISNENNILLNPEKILYTVKITPQKSEIDKLKIRSLSDDVVLHKGNYNFKENEVEKKQLVLDLIQDKDGNKNLGLREMTNEEIESGEYHLSEECLKRVEEEKTKLGYVKENGRYMNTFYNTINTQAYLEKIESQFYSVRIKKRLNNLINKFRKNDEVKYLPEAICYDKHKEFCKQYEFEINEMETINNTFKEELQKENSEKEIDL